jgi:hypothetical protein
MRRARRAIAVTAAVLAAGSVLWGTSGRVALAEAEAPPGVAPAPAAAPSAGGGPAVGQEGDARVTADQVVRPPIGVIDRLDPGGPGQLVLTGWALDPDDGEAHPRIDVHVGGPAGTGVGRSYGAVNRYRPDVAGAYGGRVDRGFAIALTDLAGGPTTICVYAVGREAAANRLLGCPTATVPVRGAHDPFGSLDVVSVLGERAVRARGWAIDPDDPATPVRVRVQALQTHPAGSALLGVPTDPCTGLDAGCTDTVRPLVADDDKETDATVARPDVGAAYPAAGDAHGFDHTVTRREYRPSPLPFDTARLESGLPTRVCAWAIGVGPGVDTLLGCRWVDIPPPTEPAIAGQVYVPRASTDVLPPGVLSVEGWLSKAGPGGSPGVTGLGLRVTVGGPEGTGVAHDLGPITGFGGFDAAFRFRLTQLPPGRPLTCAYAQDPATGRSVLVACWYAVVR